MKLVFPTMEYKEKAMDYIKEFHEVLVACNKENVASAGVIKNCGGVLKDEFFSETYQEMTQMYCISCYK